MTAGERNGGAAAQTVEPVFGELPDAPPRRKLRLSRTGKVSVCIIAFWLILALVGFLIAPYSEAEFIEEDLQGNYYLDPSFLPPSQQTWLGTDYIGRDVLSRILWGARTTIGISLAATLLAYLVGITLGITAAVTGGWTDVLLSRAAEVVLSFPSIMLGLIVIAAFGSSIALLVVLAGFVYTAPVYRIARALGQDIMVQDFVEAARARGESRWWIIRREVLPSAVMPLATDFGLRLIFVILFISSLSFLGLGVQPPMADWGSMVRENLLGLGNGLAGGAIASLAPAVAIGSLTIAINLVVDDLSVHEGGRLADKMV
ncbi:MAG: ABC transporter permease [Kiloniellales bacterium]